VLPIGADTVIPKEEALFRNGHLVLTHPLEPGGHIRRAASVIRAGKTVAESGEFLSPALTGLLAAAGIPKVRVARKVKAGVVSTGDEIVDLATRARPWQAHNSNKVMIAGQVREIGSEVEDLGICSDSLGDIVDCLRSAEGCDVIVLTGGSSMGRRDLVGQALEVLGCRILLKGIRLRPGKHVIFARKGRRVFFGLPGTPAGCFVLFHMLVRPAILGMMGSTRSDPVRHKALWEAGPTERPAVDTLLAVSLGGTTGVRPVSTTRCGDLAGLARADAVVLLKAGAGRVRKGDKVDVFPLCPVSR
jgi:molybdopterin molybdotransferase